MEWQHWEVQDTAMSLTTCETKSMRSLDVSVKWRIRTLIHDLPS